MGAGSFLTAAVVTNRDRFITNWRDWQALSLQIGPWLLQNGEAITNRRKITNQDNYYKCMHNKKVI